jgi:hypothetical protein
MEKKWRAKLNYERKSHSLGSYDTREEAAAAYDKAARQQLGAGAVCNFETAEQGKAAVAQVRLERRHASPSGIIEAGAQTEEYQKMTRVVLEHAKRKQTGAQPNTTRQQNSDPNKAAKRHAGDSPPSAACGHSQQEQAQGAEGVQAMMHNKVEIKTEGGKAGMVKVNQDMAARFDGNIRATQSQLNETNAGLQHALEHTTEPKKNRAGFH